MGVIAILLGLSFPGNGYHCFGSPGATGDILPYPHRPYIAGISVLIARPFDDPVAWIYTSSAGKEYVQVGKGGAVKPFPGDVRNQVGLRRFRCTFPMRYSPMSS
jgi:hypothetical protein